MKYFLIATVMSVALDGFAVGGSEIGNGGNVIVCRNSTGTIQSVELLDYYELRINNTALRLDPELSTWRTKLERLMRQWMNVAPKRSSDYFSWLQTFESEASIYPGVEIPTIPDTGSVVIPRGCNLEPVAFQRRDDDVVLGASRYVINKDLWDLMDETQKAGLVLHELIYRQALKMYHATSFPTRRLNGFLSSAQPEADSYARLVAQMPLGYVEYGGAVFTISSRLTCNSSGQCTPAEPNIGINATGFPIRYGEVTDFLDRFVNWGTIHFDTQAVRRRVGHLYIDSSGRLYRGMIQARGISAELNVRDGFYGVLRVDVPPNVECQINYMFSENLYSDCSEGVVSYVSPRSELHIDLQQFTTALTLRSGVQNDVVIGDPVAHPGLIPVRPGSFYTLPTGIRIDGIQSYQISALDYSGPNSARPKYVQFVTNLGIWLETSAGWTFTPHSAGR